LRHCLSSLRVVCGCLRRPQYDKISKSSFDSPCERTGVPYAKSHSKFDPEGFSLSSEATLQTCNNNFWQFHVLLKKEVHATGLHLSLISSEIGAKGYLPCPKRCCWTRTSKGRTAISRRARGYTFCRPRILHGNTNHHVQLINLWYIVSPPFANSLF
jgi:hypothetical protein